MLNDLVVHVIDDDDAARDALQFLLSAADFSVRTYGSAKVFLDAIPAAEAGCVITDVRMPEITGLELLRRLRTQGIGWPVIVITGQAMFLCQKRSKRGRGLQRKPLATRRPC
jgi:two-component system response regulator FixJ